MPTDVFLLVPPDLATARLEACKSGLGIQYLAAVLRKDKIEVELLDACLEDLTVDQIVTRIRQAAPKILGISLVSSLGMEASMEVVKRIRKEIPNTLIVLGGLFSTFGSNELLQQDGLIDAVVRGEGEITMRELTHAVLQGRNWKGLDGIAFRNNNGAIYTNPSRPLIANLDAFPFPARDITQIAVDKGGPITISSSRGCPHRCKFCSIQPFFRIASGAPWRYRSAKNVVDEIEYLVKSLPTNDIYFVDENFIGSSSAGAERAKRIAKEIIHRGLNINFFIECRADDVVVYSDVLRLLWEAGLTRICLGIEFGWQPTLDLYNKQLKLIDSQKALVFLEDLGVIIRFGFMLLHPYSTMEEVRANIQFLKGTRPIHLWSIPNLAQMQVYANTTVKSMLERENRLEGDFVWHSYQIQDRQVSRLRKLIRQSFEAILPAYLEVRNYQFRSQYWKKKYLQTEDGRALRQNVLDIITFLNNTTIEFLEKIIQHIEQGNPAKDQEFVKDLTAEVTQRSYEILQLIEISSAIFLRHRQFL